MTEPDRRHAKRRFALRSARIRMLVWTLLLVGLTFAGITATELVVIAANLRERVDVRLAHSVSEFRSFAASRSDPARKPIGDVLSLLESAQRYLVPDEHETFVSFVDGRALPRTPPELAASLANAPRAASARDAVYGDAMTSAGRLRYAAVPVFSSSGPDRGTFVVVAFPDQESAAVVEGLRTHLFIGAGAMVLAAAVGWLVSSHLVAPLRMLRDTAASISQSDLTRRIPVRGQDEVADLTDSFNAMLDRLETAFDAQRRLINDVGHELRTPITIVRGQLDTISHDRERQAAAAAVATDELDRMNRMVGELLTLAKTQQPDFLHPEPIELSELVDEVFVKANALAPRRRWLLEAPDPTAPTVLSGDRHRLTQALLQLADNAVQHTPRDSHIWIGARAGQTTARIWVRDNGPGVPPDQQERIFERFARASASRDRGTGLGLVIVKAIAEAHSGRVRLDNRPGKGATFVLELPLADAAGREERPHLGRETNP